LAETCATTLDQPFDLARFARQAGYGSHHFTRQFHRVTGMTPRDWFIRQKMQHARTLLTLPNMMVKDVANRLGYLADALVIGSTLRLVDGMTPGVATDPASGNYCLIMPCRFTEETEDGAEMKPETTAPAGGNAPVPAIAA
jgi:AraC-like DNA-binding protein